MRMPSFRWRTSSIKPKLTYLCIVVGYSNDEKQGGITSINNFVLSVFQERALHIHTNTVDIHTRAINEWSFNRTMWFTPPNARSTSQAWLDRGIQIQIRIQSDSTIRIQFTNLLLVSAQALSNDLGFQRDSFSDGQKLIVLSQSRLPLLVHH